MEDLFKNLGIGLISIAGCIYLIRLAIVFLRLAQ